MVVLTPEVAGLAASAFGVLGLILRKARCFLRRVGNSWDGGIGFCDSTIVPAKSTTIVNPCDRRQEPAEYRHRPASSNFSEYLQRGTEVIGAIQAGVKIG